MDSGQHALLMSHCGHRAVCLCPCADPPFLLCNACLPTHVFDPSHPNVVWRPYDPAETSPEQHNQLLREVEKEVHSHFQAIERGVQAQRMQVQRELKTVMLSAYNELTQSQPLSRLAQAIRSNTWKQALGLDTLCQGALAKLDEAMTQIRQQIRPEELLFNQSTLFDLHYLQHEYVQTWDYGQQVMKPQQIRLSQYVRDISCYLNSAINEVFVCSGGREPCYRVRTDTGAVTVVNAMRVSRLHFGAYVNPETGLVYVMGGVSRDSSVLKSSEKLRRSPEGEDYWAEQREIQVARSHFQPAEHAGCLYLIGGSHASYEKVQIQPWLPGRMIPVPDLTGSCMTFTVAVQDELVLIWGNSIRTTTFALIDKGETLNHAIPIPHSPTLPGVRGTEIWMLQDDGNVVRFR